MRRVWTRLVLILVLVVPGVLSAAPASIRPAAPQQAAALGSASSDAGPSLYLNGASYIAVPHAAVPTLGEDWTIEAWIYPTNLSGCRAVVGKDYLSGFWFGLCNGYVRFYRGGPSSIQSTMAIPLNQWSHIAVSTFYDPWENSYLAEIIINGDSTGYYSIAGSGVVGGTSELHIGNDRSIEYFVGDIAEVRLWGYARSSIETRRDAYSTLDQHPAGLLANWHLTADYRDALSGVAGTPVGTPALVGYVSPAQPATTPVDEFFNTLPEPLYGAGTAYVPRLDRALLVGGYRSGAASAAISVVDAGSGSSIVLGTLPAPLALSAAAYAESNDTVYVFGGSPSSSSSMVATIYAINPTDGTVRTLAATLPQPLHSASAVYQPELNTIVVLGGYSQAAGPLDSVYLFDVASESISTAPFALPQAMDAQSAVYSSVDAAIYVFGGKSVTSMFDTVLRLTLRADGGEVAVLPATLPQPESRAVAFADPTTGLIYIAGGTATTRLLAFDPQTGELWRTPLELPVQPVSTAEPYATPPASKIKQYSSAVYSPRNRHALIMGGGVGGVGSTGVWRIPLGDGPLVQLGKWDFFPFASQSVTALDGDERALVIGTNAGAWLFYTYGSDALPTQTFYNLGGSATAVSWDREGARPYFAANKQVYLGWPSGATSLVHADQWDVQAIEPTGANRPPTFGVNTVNAGFTRVPSWYAATGSLSAYSYATYGPACSTTSSIKYGPGPLLLNQYYWGVNQVRTSCAGTRPTLQAPTVDPPAHVFRLRRSPTTGAWSSTDLGTLCATNPFVGQKIAFGRNRDLWVAGLGGVCRYPAASLPDSAAPQYSVYSLPYATNSNNVSVDGDGRVWFSTSGGLSAFEARRDGNASLATLRASDFTRLNAPIGAANGASALSALAAVGEKVFAARGDMIYSLSQRWNQLDPGGPIQKIWTVRGRLFAASADTLHTLQPDGLTWLHQPAAVSAVLGDRSGNIWIGHAGGVQWWTPAGDWQTIPGLDLNEPVHALAEDAQGRIWLGLDDGVALYDRSRLVARITPPTGNAPVTSLLADRGGNLWAGSSAGLARFNAADASWTLFSRENGGLPAPATNSITDLTERGDGALFASTSGGVVRLDLAATAFSALAGSVGPAPLTTDELARVWAGNSVETANDTWRWFYWNNSGIRAAQVSDIAADRADRVWFAHPDGGISVRGSFLPPLAEEVPTITGITPTSGSAGQTITINGSGFGSDVGAVSVEVGGAAADVVRANGTYITVRLRPENISGAVSVRRGKRTTSFNNTTGTAFCAVPRIFSVSPSGTNIGGQVEIRGSNIDPQATVTIGSGPARPAFATPSLARLTLEASDTSGNLVVNNACAGAAATFADFRKLNLSIARGQLNQGYVGMPLSAGNATVASAWVSVDQPLRATDQVQLDYFQVQIGQYTIGQPLRAAIPLTVGPPPTGVLRDMTQAVNISNIIYTGSGDQSITMQLHANGRTAAATSFPATFAAGAWPRVLLIAIVPDTFSGAQINAFKRSISGSLADYRTRIFPGGLEPVWSAEVIRKSQITGNAQVAIDQQDQWLQAGLLFQQIRQRYNSTTTGKAGIAFGVVEPSIAGTSKAAGLGSFGTLSRWNSYQECIDNLVSDVLDYIDIDICGPEYPQYLGWAVGDGNASRYFAHELAHMMGLVPNTAINYASYPSAGASGDHHSGASELNDSMGNAAACGDAGATFTMGRSLYLRVGVQEPIVNPISGAQLLPQNSGGPDTNRGKAIMSYACGRSGTNTFLEPSDINFLLAERFSSLRPIYQPGQRTQRPPAQTDLRDRLSIAGRINHDDVAVTGSIDLVELKPSSVPLSADYIAGYALVEYDAAGSELLRQGVFPVGDHHTTPHDAHDPGPPESAASLFFANLPKAPGVVRIDLVHADTVLASWSGGAAAPSVSITSPSGGESVTDALVASWTASDPDGDSLAVSVQFSRDDGATWTPLAAAAGSGSTTLPATLLAGSNSARVRVWVSDGLNAASATSAAFSVAAQPPEVFIAAPAADASFLEGQPVTMRGQASDPQEDPLAGEQLVWSSDRDGVLGSGDTLNTTLSAGQHTLTLRATNAAGLSSSASLTLTVAADYDGDGLLDSEESTLGLNLLNAADALSDSDGDGLLWRTEHARGTDPTQADSDGDGRSDSAELADGSDPLVSDAPAPDLLQVAPLSMTFDVDLAQGGQLPQQVMEAFSRSGAAVTLSSAAPWLDFSAAAGSTPFVSTIVLNPILLTDGTQTATITVSSSLGSVAVPVTVNVSNKAAFCDVDGSGSGDAADLAAVQARIGSSLGDQSYAIRFDVDRDGMITTADVQLLAGCVGVAVPGWRVYMPWIAR